MVRKTFYLHLVSDSTGETVNSVSRAVIAQFEGVEPEEHNWSLVRTKGQMEKVLEGIRENPGFVMYTVADKDLRGMLKAECDRLKIPCVSILSRVISDLSGFLGIETSVHTPGKQYQMDEEYFSKVEALNFSLTHDDGQSTWDLEEADIIVIGASRTSKSPTCMYLAYRGYRAANIPFVKGIGLPGVIYELEAPLIVAVTVSAERLVQIRKSRLQSLDSNEDSSYVDMDEIKDELKEVRKICAKQGWPIIDVTRKSIEETAAAIIQFFENRKIKKEK